MRNLNQHHISLLVQKRSLGLKLYLCFVSVDPERDNVEQVNDYVKVGGRNGITYVVTDSSDDGPVNPIPGTLRHAVIQEKPLWIIFKRSDSYVLDKQMQVCFTLLHSFPIDDSHLGYGNNC
ncbi:hypothetical protein Nepgr_026154 [Nepenthes gracilis]|uniref:Uncharacterized protein n=1 Tax=Nepenthes gracilis TaxID=150966 RepID=A0AAD3T848_NEPGR|nr:hypothetical protein Nepgr_026154 [Nepenthes gracilis]